MNDPIFQKGEYDTGFIPQNIDTLLQKETPNDPYNIVCSIVARNHSLTSASPLPNELFNFRNIHNTSFKHTITVNETFIEGEHKFEASVRLNNKFQGVATLNGQTYEFTYKEIGQNQLQVIVNGQVRKVEYFTKGTTVHLFNSQGDSTGYRFESDQRAEAVEESGAGSKALTPMPGTISKIFVKEGAQLKKGDAIFAMEAMKMEHVIRASGECKVSKIIYKEGDFVEAHREVVHLE